ncbi:hypothetical protein EV645_2266 [Kribbella rubisoli]|uniref:Uncharacterized protein n=1 Tax=Kribbella rubisoli TaxID=3075929 RepID=A0A4Q7XB89_9ACTN|nr:hypothetical protein [Kribbella rubisoli]RZU20045.1 hypothetical protein EV645_2266 [Kribbella rubisoli]
MTLSDVVAATWFQTLGGWSNLLQGLGSAVVSGLVAALTAYLVVRWTHKSEMRVATEMDARSVVRSLTADSLKVLADVQELINQPIGEVAERLRRLQVEVRLCRMRFGTAFNINFPTIALVDEAFVLDTMSPLVNEIDKSFDETEKRVETAAEAMEVEPVPDPEVVMAAVSEAIEMLNATMLQINDLNRACASWLGDRNSRRRRRGLSTKRRAPEVPPKDPEQPPTTPDH